VTTYYVAKTGNDNNNGTSTVTPFLTINKAISVAWTVGDIVYVRTGTYVETIYIGQSNISLLNYTGESPIIDGAATLPNTDWGVMLYVVGDNNTVSGFEVKNSNVSGTYLGGFNIQVEGHHNTISKMNVHHAYGAGVLVNGDYNIVEDSIIWQNSREYIDTTITSGWGTGISASRNASSTALIPGITSYATLRRNTVFNNWGEGISCFEADNCTMEDNIVYDNWTVNLYLSDATNCLVQRNMVYISSAPAITFRNTSRPGISLADEVTTVPRSANNKIINNLLYNVNFGAFGWSEAAITGAGLHNVLIANNTVINGDFEVGSSASTPSMININSRIINNIFAGTSNVVPSSTGLTFSNNCWAVTPPTAAASISNVIGSPLILATGPTTPGNLIADYFKLAANSPARGKGVILTEVPTDFFGTSRL
jgi:parallel beta-helix repeat protein